MTLEIIKTNNFKEHRIDIVVIDGVEYFIVDQIARALEYSEIRKLYEQIKKWNFRSKELIKIPKNESSPILRTDVVFTPNYSFVYLVNEYGLYKILFNSRARRAEEFTDWVVYDLLPSVRKKGYYISPRVDINDLTLSIAKNLNKQLLIVIENQEKLAEEVRETKKIAEKALEGKPLITKKQYWDIYDRIKDLKNKKDKHIWRDVERVFKVSNIGQILQEDYLSVMVFLDEREEELLRSQVRLNQL